MTRILKCLLAGGALVAFAGIINAQNSGITRTPITKADVSVAGREAVMTRAEIAPGGVAGWHTHPGDEITYVMEGEATLLIAGKPPRKVVGGEGFVIPAGIVHSARNDSASVVKILGVFLVEKGQPLGTPASAPAQ